MLSTFMTHTQRCTEFAEKQSASAQRQKKVGPLPSWQLRFARRKGSESECESRAATLKA